MSRVKYAFLLAGFAIFIGNPTSAPAASGSERECTGTYVKDGPNSICITEEQVANENASSNNNSQTTETTTTGQGNTNNKTVKECTAGPPGQCK